MTLIHTHDEARPAETNIVQFDGHIFQGNTFRSPSSRLEGSPVLIGRIHNRHEVFIEGVRSHDDGACFPASPKE